jgi:hypothetical protein
MTRKKPTVGTDTIRMGVQKFAEAIQWFILVASPLDAKCMPRACLGRHLSAELTWM